MINYFVSTEIMAKVAHCPVVINLTSWHVSKKGGVGEMMASLLCPKIDIAATKDYNVKRCKSAHTNLEAFLMEVFFTRFELGSAVRWLLYGINYFAL
jgi:hypothetical protein